MRPWTGIGSSQCRDAIYRAFILEEEEKQRGRSKRRPYMGNELIHSRIAVPDYYFRGRVLRGVDEVKGKGRMMIPGLPACRLVLN